MLLLLASAACLFLLHTTRKGKPESGTNERRTISTAAPDRSFYNSIRQRQRPGNRCPKWGSRLSSSRCSRCSRPRPPAPGCCPTKHRAPAYAGCLLLLFSPALPLWPPSGLLEEQAWPGLAVSDFGERRRPRSGVTKRGGGASTGAGQPSSRRKQPDQAPRGARAADASATEPSDWGTSPHRRVDCASAKNSSHVGRLRRRAAQSAPQRRASPRQEAEKRQKGVVPHSL